jgi:S-adenosylmethionine decarboxylase proenzyme
LAEFHGCTVAKLNNVEYVESSMRIAARAAGATIVNSSFHQFGPQGVSGVLVLAESHLSVHTWPEHAYASADIYVCGDTCSPELAQASLAQALGAGQTETMTIERGLDAPQGKSIRVVAHEGELGAKLGDPSTKPSARSDGPSTRPK